MIQQDWEFMAADDCIPVQVGLQLMDSSTLGKADREPDFIRTYKQIQKSLKSIVNGLLDLMLAPQTCFTRAITKNILF